MSVAQVFDSLSVSDSEIPQKELDTIKEILEKGTPMKAGMKAGMNELVRNYHDALVARGMNPTLRDVAREFFKCEKVFLDDEEIAAALNAGGPGSEFVKDELGFDPDDEVSEGELEARESIQAADFDESQHPRLPAGSPGGGEFTSGGESTSLQNTPVFISEGVSSNDRYTPVFISEGVSSNDRFMANVIAADHPSLEKHGVGVKLEPESKNLGDFEVGGQTFSKGGHYDPVTRMVMGHPNPTIMAHEMGHAEMDFALHQRHRGLQDYSMSVQAEKADIYDANYPHHLRADDRYANPQGPRQEIHNKLLDFQHSLRDVASLLRAHDEAYPTDYSKAWKKERIFDRPDFVDHPVGYEAGTPYGGRKTLRFGGPIPRHVNEAYAEFNAGIVHKKLLSKGILESVPQGYDFKKMGNAESRKAFLELREAIHAAAKDKSI